MVTATVIGPVDGAPGSLVVAITDRQFAHVSIGDGGASPSGASTAPTLGLDGRYVAFLSSASNLTTGTDANAAADVFVRDMMMGTTSRISLAADGGDPDAASSAADISGDGARVVFRTTATNMVTGTVDGAVHYLWERGATPELTRLPFARGESPHLRISETGAFVFYTSRAVPAALPAIDDSSGTELDLYRYQIDGGTFVNMSLNSAGGTGVAYLGENAFLRGISPTGRYAGFHYAGRQMDTEFDDHVARVAHSYVRDAVLGRTKRIDRHHGSMTTCDSPGSSGATPSLLGDLWFFHTTCPIRVLPSSGPNHPGGHPDVFVRVSDFDSPTSSMVTERVVVGLRGAVPDGKTEVVAISSDAAARYVLVSSEATNLVAGDTNGVADLFVVDRTDGSIQRVSVDGDGAQIASVGVGDLSGDGRFVVFETTEQLLPTDTNSVSDIYMLQLP
ncbi:MAG TPA: hypothetical protein ENK57_11480 [Polyangiaceae bacterium]|nr:hypothetical protein [Polyangiaceae bacterium]